MPTTANFEPQYAAMRGAPRLPAMEAVFTTAASLEARNAATAAWVIRKTPFTLTANTVSHCVSLKSSSAPLSTTPALLTSTSRPPKASTVACTAAAHEAASVTSRGVQRTSPSAARSPTASFISACDPNS